MHRFNLSIKHVCTNSYLHTNLENLGLNKHYNFLVFSMNVTHVTCNVNLYGILWLLTYISPVSIAYC